MADVREQTTGFTVTFRSLVLRAFTGSAPGPLVLPGLTPARPVPCAPLAPLSDRVREALTELPPNETETRVIGALLRHPGATSAVLSSFCGWRQPIWQTHFGLMCQRRAAWLWPVGQPPARDANFLTGVLVDYRQNRRSFAFKPDVAAALRSLPVDWHGCA